LHINKNFINTSQKYLLIKALQYVLTFFFKFFLKHNVVNVGNV
jgi:hypothetical protein